MFSIGKSFFLKAKLQDGGLFGYAIKIMQSDKRTEDCKYNHHCHLLTMVFFQSYI